ARRARRSRRHRRGDARQHRAAARRARRDAVRRPPLRGAAFSNPDAPKHTATESTRKETSMSMYGANPEQRTSLGNNLIRQIEAIHSVISTVSAALGGTTWEGPARVQFESDWNATFRTALDRLSTAFDAAGRDCLRRSQDLQVVMGAR